MKKQWHKGSIPVQRWCLPGSFSGSLNSFELLRCTQLRTASQHLFLDLDPLTVALDDGTFLTVKTHANSGLEELGRV